MRSKGQVSFDLIFAVIALGVFLYFLVVFVDDFTTHQNRINIRNQEMDIALTVKSAINACEIADVGPLNNDTRVTVALPMINELGSPPTASRCRVEVPFQGSQSVGVSYTLTTGEVVSYSVPVSEWGGTMLHTCGQTIEVRC